MSAPNEPGSAARLAARVPEGARLPGDAILDRFLAWVTQTGLEPYAAQEEAILELFAGRHVVLQTPTGSGKSLVALALHFKALCEGRRSFYTAPIKALVSEKFFALCDELGAENVGMLTGDASINWAAPVVCCTAEVLAQMALRQGEAADAPYVVMDEFHYYGDRDRGVAWQIPLLELPRTTFLLMSATLGNTAPIEERLRARTGREVAHVFSDERPVPLDFRYCDTPLLETIERLLSSGEAPIYLVHFTQREAAEQAQGLTSAPLLTRPERERIAAELADFRFDTPYGKDMRRFLRHGVGVHHAGLLPKYRLLVEQLAQQGLLKVVCGTDTLGGGVNVPIRTVLFTRLSKFDGEKVSLLSARAFKQIAGRAGRKGFDERGTVACQAPEHEIENRRLEAKAARGRRRPPKKKRPPTGFVGWNEKTFERLTHQPPEPLASRFRLDHGLLVAVLQREHAAGAGYRAVAELVAHSHESARRKRQLLRDAAVLFRSLRKAGVVELVRDAEGVRGVRVQADLQRDFSLHQTLSLYLVDALSALDPAEPDYASSLVSLVEAILEDPRAILQAQVRRQKDELMAQLKAERVPYEERLARLDEVEWPQPEAEFLLATFAVFAEHHPWVASQNIRPKSIARDMVETYASFDDYVRRQGLARMEGLLLRYLSQVHGTLARSVPDAAKTDEVHGIIAYLRAMLARVDASLVQEWESLVRPGEVPEALASEVDALRSQRERDVLSDPRAFRARVRAELHQLVQALASRDYEVAASCLAPDEAEPWTAERLQEALAERPEILFDPRARRSEWTLVKERTARCFDVYQTLLDADAEPVGTLAGEIDLRNERDRRGPLLRLLEIQD
ncbi:MAG: DUF3516 domain-containing protein [Proteobacteria bacterium]|nr:DUF3516 domain-containing protein [Pseudomonadota bacterium]